MDSNESNLNDYIHDRRHLHTNNGYNHQQEETKEFIKNDIDIHFNDNQQKQTLHEFLSEHGLNRLEVSLNHLNITMDQLLRIHVDDLDDLIIDLKLDELYPQQEILFRTAINQLQSDNSDTQQFISRTAAARSISHTVIEKQPTDPELVNSKDYDHLVKIVMVGDASVGKSNLVVRFCDDSFSPSYISTIGVDFKFRTLQYNDVLVKLQVWDTAGQERFRAITSAYYRSANGLFLCYDITNKRTFDNLPNWLEGIRRHTESFVIIVGCKLDLVLEQPHRRKVKTSDIALLAEKYKLPFIEVSGKTGQSVDELFFTATDCIMKALLDNQDGKKHGAANSISVDPDMFKRKKKKKKCCK